MKSKLRFIFFTALGIFLCLFFSQCQKAGQKQAVPQQAPQTEQLAPATPPEQIEEKDPGVGMAALKQAAEANKHLFVFFYEGKDEATRKLKKTFQLLMSEMPDTAQGLTINRKDPLEKGIRDKFQIQNAPMPLLLVIAPNGAITSGAPVKDLSRQRLQEAIASPCLQKSLKALQERKVVFVCVQNRFTQYNKPAMQGINDFKADARFSQFTEIVNIDPTDGAEIKLLGQLQIDPASKEAITALLVPPGSMIAKFQGPTYKEELIAALQKASSGCGTGGCGPKGCGP